MQIRTDERKGQGDWLSLLIRVLSCERVHDVLMNERRIAMRECVAAQFVIGI